MREIHRDSVIVVILACLIIGGALFYLTEKGLTYVHIDAIAHVNKARGLFDSLTPGLKQLGSIWLPLPHILIAPLSYFDRLWTSGLAGSLLSAACFVGTGWLLFATAFAWAGSRAAAWIAFLCFASNPRLIYLFTTPMTEPLMILCAAGLGYFLIRWTQTQSWRNLALAAGFTVLGTLTRYEGWALAATAVLLVFLIARTQRVTSTILFAGAAAIGPMLWMIYNMVYFDDPLMFTYGRGSAQDYAMEHFLRTGKLYATAGSWTASFGTYVVNAAYCLNPTVLWLGLAGILLALAHWKRDEWRTSAVLTALCVVPFAFYVFNLYSNMIPVLMPGLIRSDPQSIFNVRYGTALASTVPVFAGYALHQLFRKVDQQRPYAFLFILLVFLPNPIPAASIEPANKQLTDNLFYREGIRNQSYWMPAFVEIGEALAADIARTEDGGHLILANSRIIHPVVWATGIPMRRFVQEMNKERWEANLNEIDSGVRWVITEEGDQLWHARGRFLQEEFEEVARTKAPSTRVVHLYRRR